MKRFGYLYDKICDKDNIRLAIKNAAKGKTGRKEIKQIFENVEYYVNKLHTMLINEEYQPSPYTQKTIFDGANKKERVIFKPQFFPDQCIHWALMLQIEPILSRGLYAWNCASIKQRGIHYGAKHISKIMKTDTKNTKYCLKLDVRKYYPSIDKEILKQKFRKIIKDKRTLNLIDKIIDSNEQGLPIGNYTSQWFANFYLQDFDHYLKEKLGIVHYVRYMDDIVIFHSNKRRLHKIREIVKNYLSRYEHLQVKDNWQLFKTDSRPLDFLGYRFYREHITLRRSNFLRIRRRCRKIANKPKLTYPDACAFISFCGWIKHANLYGFYKNYMESYVSLDKCKEVVRNESRKHREAICNLH